MIRNNRKSRPVNLRLLTKIDNVFAANSEFQYLENRLKIGRSLFAWTENRFHIIIDWELRPSREEDMPRIMELADVCDILLLQQSLA